jgi:hypothetical protein
VREGADVERALGPSFFPLHTSYFQTQTHRPCNDETGVRGFPKTPTSRPRQTCDSPRPTGYIMQFSSKDGRSETPFSSGLDGETPEGLTIRIPVPHGNRCSDG